MELVTYRLEGPVAIIGLNRPDKRNAIDSAVIEALKLAVLRAGDEADAGVIHGNGTNFSAGLDLAELAEQMGKPRPRRRKPHPWHTTFDLIARGTVPFVAALHGPTIGGGLELAAAAHIRVADDSTLCGLPEGQRGIFVGGGGTVRIQRLIGYGAMADLMLTGRLLTAEEALAARLVQYVVPSGAGLPKAIEIATRIAGNTALFNWQIANVLPRINDLSHDDGLFLESLNAAMERPPESRERIRSFLDKTATRLV